MRVYDKHMLAVMGFPILDLLLQENRFHQLYK